MSITSFKGTSSIGEYSFNEILEHNIISYLDWSFLGIGAFTNINISSSGAYGGSAAKLRLVNDRRYSTGQVWEGFRTNWVWQTGVAYSIQPVDISGVYVNNSFLPINNGYYIDYPNGRVIFNTGIATTSTVKLEHSFKWVNVVSADIIPWFREGQTRSFRLDDTKFNIGSGIWNQNSETRVQLPAIAVEIIKTKNFKGYQLGGGHWIYTRVILHVLAEDDMAANRLTNILANQVTGSIFAYDLNKVKAANRFPLTYRGSRNPFAVMYPQMIETEANSGYRCDNLIYYGLVHIKDSIEEGAEKISNSLYHGSVTWELESVSQII